MDGEELIQLHKKSVILASSISVNLHDNVVWDIVYFCNARHLMTADVIFKNVSSKLEKNNG